MRSIQSGRHFRGACPTKFAENERQRDHAGELLPNVRLTNGVTFQETRQRLMLAFNSPFYREVLVASSIMAEGVHLHVSCRQVIHYDLSWNPSNVEQRTG